MEMDLVELIQQLEDAVQQAKAMPLSSSVLINREELLELIERMRTELPTEIQQARHILNDREALLARAKGQAQELVARGHAEQARLAEQEEVVHRAHQEAARIVADAQDAARALRLEAEAYADGKLAELAEQLHAALEVVGRTETTLAQGLAQAEHGRERLRVPLGSAVPVAEPAPSPVAAGPFDEETQA